MEYIKYIKYTINVADASLGWNNINNLDHHELMQH